MRPTTAPTAAGSSQLRARTITRVAVVGFAGNPATANETGSSRSHPADVAHPKAVGTSY
jgi:hypothetical protein